MIMTLRPEPLPVAPFKDVGRSTTAAWGVCAFPLWGSSTVLACMCCLSLHRP